MQIISKKSKDPGITRVKLIAHSRRVYKKVEQDLYWYDPYSKKMMTYKGTRLVYEYDKTNKRTMAKPVTEELPVYRSSWEDILEVLKMNKNQIEVVEMHPGNHAIIELEDDHFWYDIEKQLRKLSIRYEIDDEDNSGHSGHARDAGQGADVGKRTTKEPWHAL